jgi:hypothetical protein
VTRCYICNHQVSLQEAINLGKVVIHRKWWLCRKVNAKQ